MPVVPQLITTQKAKPVDLPKSGQHQVAELPDQSSSLSAWCTEVTPGMTQETTPSTLLGVCATGRIKLIPLTTAIKLFGRKCQCAQKGT